MTRLRLTLALTVAACIAHAQPITQGDALASDDFARFTDATTELGEAWGKAVTPGEGAAMENLARGMNGALWIGYASGTVNAPGVFLRDPQIADGIIEMTVGPSTMGERPHTAVISYRAPTGEAAGNGTSAGAYHLWLMQDWSGSRDLVLDYGGQRLATADLAGAHAPKASYRVRVACAGAHHVVSLSLIHI